MRASSVSGASVLHILAGHAQYRAKGLGSESGSQPRNKGAFPFTYRSPKVPLKGRWPQNPRPPYTRGAWKTAYVPLQRLGIYLLGTWRRLTYHMYTCCLQGIRLGLIPS